MEDMENDESDVYMEINTNEVVIEEVDTEDLLENELSQFRIITPGDSAIVDPNLTRSSVIASTSLYTHVEPILPEHEEILIKKLINGEIAFSDYNAQIGNILEDDVIIDDLDENIEDENDSEPVVAGETISAASGTSSNDDFTNELFASRRDAFRGNLTGRAVNKEGKFTRRRCNLPPALQVHFPVFLFVDQSCCSFELNFRG